MSGDKLPIALTTAEQQVLVDHPVYFKRFIYALVLFATGFNIYVSLSGRILASLVLSLLLAGFAGVLAVMKSNLHQDRKIQAYRHLFQAQLLVFGLYLVGMVGISHHMDVNYWCFLFVFIISLWMPDRRGIWAVLVFNICIVAPDLFWYFPRFLAEKEVLIRFYVALIFFSAMVMSAGRLRNQNLSNLYAARAGLEQSEKKLLELNRKLIQEIQHRDRIEKRLHHAIKMETVGRVAAGVAHDLNNILSGIVTYPELLLLDIESGDPLRKPLETIRASGIRASAIVEDLLTLSRRGMASMQALDLCGVVAEYLGSPEHRQLMADFPQVAVHAGYASETAFVKGSAVHLGKTLMNLVRNGAESVTGPGQVMVEVSPVCLESPLPLPLRIQGEQEIPAGAYVRLTVEDNGAGIEAREQEFIFEPFYTRKKMGRSGTGLGMALALGSVNDHGGYLHLVSSPGKGTRIDLFFPAADKGETLRSQPLDLSSLMGEGTSVLVVDDEPVQLRIAQTLLERLGYNVFSCDSGEKALAFLKSEPVALVILDILMEPGMTGVETCEVILSWNPGQKVMFVTGYSDAELQARASELSQGCCLAKPYSIEAMGTMVKARLSEPRPLSVDS